MAENRKKAARTTTTTRKATGKKKGAVKKSKALAKMAGRVSPAPKGLTRKVGAGTKPAKKVAKKAAKKAAPRAAKALAKRPIATKAGRTATGSKATKKTKSSKIAKVSKVAKPTRAAKPKVGIGRAAQRPAPQSIAKREPTTRPEAVAKAAPANGTMSAPPVAPPVRAEAAPAPPTRPMPRPAPAATGPMTQAEQARAFAISAAQLVRDDKCTDVVLLDVRNLSQVTDYIVIGTGTSDRQMQSVLDHVEDLGKTMGYPAWKTDTDQRSTWLLLDCVDVVVHLFEPNTRAHYDLEMLWGDAPRMEWERPDQVPRDRAGLHA